MLFLLKIVFLSLKQIHFFRLIFLSHKDGGQAGGLAVHPCLYSNNSIEDDALMSYKTSIFMKKYPIYLMNYFSHDGLKNEKILIFVSFPLSAISLRCFLSILGVKVKIKMFSFFYILKNLKA